MRLSEAVEAHDLGDWCGNVGTDRVIPRGRRGDLSDTAHAHRMVVAAGQQRLPGRRAQRCGVKAVEPQPAVREALRVRGIARATENAGCAEAGIVNHHYHNIRRVFRWPERLDRRERRLRILCVVSGEADMLAVRNRQVGPGNVSHWALRTANGHLDQDAFSAKSWSGDPRNASPGKGDTPSVNWRVAHNWRARVAKPQPLALTHPDITAGSICLVVVIAVVVLLTGSKPPEPATARSVLC